MHSTKGDVERLLGRPSSYGKYVTTYNLADSVVDVTYSSGAPCGNGLTNSWNVPAGVVVNIRIIPKNDLDLNSQVQDLNRYTKVADIKDKPVSYLIDEGRGVRYTTRASSSGQQLIRVDYFPGKDENGLKCRSAQQNANDELPPFQTYGRVPLKRRNAILDNFAIQLQQEKELKGYIVAYFGPSGKRKESLRVAQSARNYLIRKRRVDPKRVLALAGGERDSAMVELYLTVHDWRPSGAR